MNTGSLRLFTGTGPVLDHWELDEGGLRRLGALALPANVQYAWPHPEASILYVASSDGGQRHGPRGDRHHLCACSVDPGTGAIAMLGASFELPSRPIHVTAHPSGRYLLVAFSQPAALRVYAIHDDGSPGAEVRQGRKVAAGNYAHQVRVSADGSCVLATALGQNPSAVQAEEPGSINVFAFEQGQLLRQQVVAPERGFGFGPRHLDIHPNGRWIYVSLERQNLLQMFELRAGKLSAEAVFSQSLLSGPQDAGIRQAGGAVHVHPNGRFVYGVNRAWETMDAEGTPALAGGENTLAVYELDRASGAPSLVQHIDTQGIHCRTFHLAPDGRTLVAAHIMGGNVRADRQIRGVPPGLSAFHVDADGRLAFDRFHPFETNGSSLFWMGIPAFRSGQPKQDTRRPR